MPDLETERLWIRPFLPQDLDTIHQLFKDIHWHNPELSDTQNYIERDKWLKWAMTNYVQLAQLHQPPYGDRAVVLKASNLLIGMCGIVPYVSPFGQIPYFGGRDNALYTAEVGLMWAISPSYQGQGYATEAAQALVDYAFAGLRLSHIIATTEHDNLASQAVMHRLGMLVQKNPYPEPPWLQVVGILENKHIAH
ncbi:MAG: GNAT family N-acetyltransferase [Ardenticatenaceae bacterium]|nr:GNAT family N-acetyltransferase [Ardenticatenaceae bacterium]